MGELLRRTGLALGGGGARGLAHILTLEVLDECGVRPDRITGTSMGAIIGTIYAAGVSGAEIREGLQEIMISKNDHVKDIWRKAGGLKNWLKFFKFSRGGEALLSADGFLDLLLEMLKVDTFEDLSIPLEVVATDYYRDERVVIGSGDLRPALKASMAIPGIFEPVIREGRVLVDGGMADDLPFNLLQDDCDVVIAVDVQPYRDHEETKPPHMVNAVVGMYDILIDRALRHRLEENPPTIYVRPELKNIGILDFDRIETVYEQSQPTMEIFRELLEEMKNEFSRTG